MTPRRALFWALKLGLVAAILYGLDSSGKLDWSKLAHLWSQWPRALAVWLILLLGTVGSVSLRWGLLLRPAGIHLSFLRLFWIHWIGSFFSSFLPTSVSSDGARAFYVLRESPPQTPKSRLLASLAVDRVLGLASVLSLALLGWWINREQAASEPVLRFLLGVILTLALGLVVFMLLILRPQNPGADPIRPWLERLPLGAYILGLYDALRLYQSQKRVLVWGLLLALLGQGLLVSAVWVAAPLACQCQAAWAPILLATPGGEVASVVPLGPMGVGLGHGVFEYIFSVLGFAQGADVFNLFTAVRLSLGLSGALPYLWFKRRDGSPGLKTLEGEL